jgi:hypothetical protein
MTANARVENDSVAAAGLQVYGSAEEFIHGRDSRGR